MLRKQQKTEIYEIQIWRIHIWLSKWQNLDGSLKHTCMFVVIKLWIITEFSTVALCSPDDQKVEIFPMKSLKLRWVIAATLKKSVKLRSKWLSRDTVMAISILLVYLDGSTLPRVNFVLPPRTEIHKRNWLG